MSAIRRLVLHQQVLARLRSLPGPGQAAAVFSAEVPEGGTPMLQAPGGGPDPSGRVAPYIVAFGGVGSSIVEPDVAGTMDELDWPVRLICVAGFYDDVLDLADRVHSWLFRWEPVHAGVVLGRLSTPPGFDPGSPRRFDQVAPVRFELPLQFQVLATAS